MLSAQPAAAIDVFALRSTCQAAVEGIASADNAPGEEFMLSWRYL